MHVKSCHLIIMDKHVYSFQDTAKIKNSEKRLFIIINY